MSAKDELIKEILAFMADSGAPVAITRPEADGSCTWVIRQDGLARASPWLQTWGERTAAQAA